MRILKIVTSSVFIISGIFILGGFLMPSKWSVTRSVVIHANRGAIYPLVSNFREWEKWSPWNSSKDATLKYTYSGPEAGAGARQAWTSEKMGSGWMKFTSAAPETGVTYDLHITRHQTQSTLCGSIVFAPENDDTKVIWTDKGDAGESILNRWISLMMRAMLSRDIDAGLMNLKTRVENGLGSPSIRDNQAYLWKVGAGILR